MKVEVVCPEESMGDVIGDLNSRRGMVGELNEKPGGMREVNATVPLSEMFNYVSRLRSVTKGRGNYTWSWTNTTSCLPTSPRRSATRRRSPLPERAYYVRLTPAFLAGLTRVLSMHRPGMVNLPAFFTSVVASEAESSSTFETCAFFNPLLSAKVMTKTGIADTLAAK